MWVWSLGGEDPLEEEMATPSQVFFPGKSHGQSGLVGYSPWGCRDSDTTEHTPGKSPDKFPRQDPRLPLESTLDHLPLALCSPAAQWPPLSCYNIISLLPSATGPLHGLWSLLGLEELSPNGHDSYYSSSAQRHSNTNQSDVSKVNSNLYNQEDKTQDS